MCLCKHYRYVLYVYQCMLIFQQFNYLRIIVCQICIRGLAGERTVKRLRLSKALTVPETTTIIEACRRMAARRVDALLLTDSNALLCGILTDKVLVEIYATRS